MILVTKWFGSFLCEEGKVRKAALFPKDAAAVADRLGRMARGEVLEEEASLAPSAKQVTDRRLADFGRRARFDSSFIRPEDFGFSLDMYREATIILAKESVKRSIGPDVHLGQAVRAYDDIVFTDNILSERLREWYGLHFPELEVVIGGETYAKAVADHGARGEVMSALGLKMDSIGSDIEATDLESVRVLSSVLRESYSARAKRLIMQAGSLKRLASMPASTVQLLGAEKAMFRHLKKGGKPPKHGILFQHMLVHAAPMWQRGAIARAIASKVCLAARADMYSGNDISALLKEQLDRRVAEIRKQHASPPKRAPGRPRNRRR